MRDGRATVAGLVLVLSALATGCGTPKEKTAPCKRPANLSSYASEAGQGCGPMGAVNNDPQAALAAIEEFAE
jgi:hypothetical protein